MPPKKVESLFSAKLNIMKKVTAAAAQANNPPNESKPTEYDQQYETESDDFTDSDSSSDSPNSGKSSPRPSNSADKYFNENIQVNQPQNSVYHDYENVKVVQPRRQHKSFSEYSFEDENPQAEAPQNQEIPQKPPNLNKNVSFSPVEDEIVTVVPAGHPAPPPPPSDPQYQFPVQQHAVSGESSMQSLVDEIKNFKGFRKQKYQPQYKKSTAAEIVRQKSQNNNNAVYSALKKRVSQIRQNITVSEDEDADDEYR